MKLISYLLERLALIVLLIGGVGMLMSMFLGVADIAGTQVLHIPVSGSRELTESTMVLIVFGALCYAQIRRAHIRVELIYLRMPPRVRAAMDVFTDLAAIVFFGLLLWQAINEVEMSLLYNEATVGLVRLPLYPARIVLAVGTGLLLVRLGLDLLIDLDRVRTGAPLPSTDQDTPELTI